MGKERNNNGTGSFTKDGRGAQKGFGWGERVGKAIGKAIKNKDYAALLADNKTIKEVLKEDGSEYDDDAAKWSSLLTLTKLPALSRTHTNRVGRVWLLRHPRSQAEDGQAVLQPHWLPRRDPRQESLPGPGPD